jgi:diguanylate cyclase (GGDEF)-like protein
LITHASSIRRITGGFLHKIICPVRWVGVLLLFSCMSNAKPLLSEPTFTHLSTEQGLSQDTVNSLLIDSQGFLWLGTDGGLNRYDGYHNIQVLGKNNEFADDGIYHLFQDSAENLWVSTYNTGVYRFNLQSGDASQIVNLKMTEQPDLTQVASYIFEDGEGKIWIAMDEAVVSYDPASEQSQILYSLSPDEVKKGYGIRWLWSDQQVLVIAQSNGLKGLDLATGQIREIPFLDKTSVSADSLNAKFLYADANDILWVGTVEGLFSLPLAAVKAYIQGDEHKPVGRLRVADRNIWRFLAKSENTFYLATDLGLYNFDPANDQLQHIFRPTDSRDYLARDDISDLVLDKNDNIWLGTKADGALYWSPKSTLFNRIFNARGGREQKTLSNNNIWTLHQQDESSLWVGTDNGLNRYDLDDGSSRRFLVSADDKAQFSAATILQILKADEEKLWLLTGDGISQFNTQTGLTSPLNIKAKEDEKLFNQQAWGASTSADGDLWFINNDGFFRYSALDGQLKPLEQLESIANSHNSLEKFLGTLPGQPEKMLVALGGQIWQWDSSTNQLTELYEIPKQKQLNQAVADSWVIDKHNVMWIAYPGYGLVGLDANTYAHKYTFTKDNLLPTNTIYSLQLDKSGDIWMSSHAGLLKFYPDTLNLQRFGHAEGLISHEFNQGAGLSLQDGRMAYGSPKGFTLFEPDKLNEQNKDVSKVSITTISLSSSPLSMPYTDLSGWDVELAHDDVGLTIGFSTMEFEYQNNTRYRYQLIGSNTLEYPVSRNSQVTFPRFSPGSYRFEVTAFDTNTGVESPPAIVNVKVGYAPFFSPLAYSMYVVSVLLLVVAWWSRRRLHNRRLFLAHQDTLRSKNRLSQALTASNSNIWEWQSDNDLYYAPRITDELGYVELGKELSCQQHVDLIYGLDRQQYLLKWQRFILQQDVTLDVTYRMQAKNGGIIWYRDVGSIVPGSAKDSTILVTGTYTNVTSTIADQEKLRLFGEAYKHTRDWVIIYNNQQLVLAANEAFYETFNIDENAVLADEVKRIYKLQSKNTAHFWQKLGDLNPDEHWSGEDKVAFEGGLLCDVIVFVKAVASVYDPNCIEYYLVVISDISEQKQAEQKLRKLASYDSLTGLPNRALLLDRIQHAIDHAVRSRTSIAVFFIDLDRFKAVNDTLGHKAGDQLLTIIAQRLKQLLRQDDTVARLGGDEFVVMIEEVHDPDKLSSIASQIIKVIDTPIQLGNQTVSVSSSIGIALFPGDASSSEELLRNADIAMYHAKENGRNNFQYFTEHMNNQAQARLILENQIKEAQQHKEFENYYQPIVNIQTGRVEGFELLMRWPTPEGMIPPDRFIPVAEELGLIEEMTWEALLRALPIMCLWQKSGFNGYLSVNLSARHFEGRISIEQISQLLRINQVPISALRFEITESALMKDHEKALTYMVQMQEQGYIIALDDFGTGYSSLKYLKEFPINVIKVDKSFVDDIGKNKNNETIILTTLKMAESMQMYCIAEGIETSEQLQFFKTHGCDHLQGYFFSKPVPEEMLDELIAQRWRC